jgi:ferrous iron transport protein B
MEWIDAVFAHAGGAVDALWAALGLEGGFIHDLLKDGVIAGIGATVIFLPQICLLFFLISILEDTGYLARGAFVMDRLLRPFGLAGHSFVPLLSSHACALPGIMATRTIPDTRQRLTTILVAPFMTCSARLPVYVLLTGLLFAGRPLAAALAFVGCYALGLTAGALSALVARRTILRGPARPMALELPSYKRPSLRTALTTALDRGVLFLRKAGTTILAIAVVLWWLGAFPRVEPPAAVEDLRQAAAALRQAPAPDDALAPALGVTAEHLGPEAEGEARALVTETEPERRTTALAEWLDARADGLEASHAKRHSLIGHLGHAVEPVFRPLGFDWQLSVGVLASFAARACEGNWPARRATTGAP